MDDIDDLPLYRDPVMLPENQKNVDLACFAIIMMMMMMMMMGLVYSGTGLLIDCSRIIFQGIIFINNLVIQRLDKIV